MRIHSTDADALGSLLLVPQRTGMKPKGLWWAVDRAWIDWCTGEEFRTETLKNHFALDVDEERILVIGRDMTMDKFDAQFGENPDALGERAASPFYCRIGIRWGQVAERWAGIEIPVYSWRHRTALSWYYGWDVASGCLWDSAALRGTRAVGIGDIPAAAITA